MKCTFEEADFRPAWLAIQWAKTGISTDNWDNDDWLNGILRVEASNGTLSLVGPFGQAHCPARIESPGVFFVSIRDFVDTTSRHSWDDEPHELEATDEHYDYSGMRCLAKFVDMALFDDPATAPQTWVPSDEPEDDDDDWDDEDDADLDDTEAPTAANNSENRA
jgi:hypothetical protein